MTRWRAAKTSPSDAGGIRGFDEALETYRREPLTYQDLPDYH